MGNYIFSLPPLTLSGAISSISGKDFYSSNDGSGLNSKYQTYNVVLTVQTQTLGDGIKGIYTSQDIRVGDYISLKSGTKTFKIISISEKSTNGLGITCVIEDVDMIVEKVTGNNNPGVSASIIIYRVDEDNNPQLSFDEISTLTINNAVDSIQSYFNVNKPPEVEQGII